MKSMVRILVEELGDSETKFELDPFALTIKFINHVVNIDTSVPR